MKIVILPILFLVNVHSAAIAADKSLPQYEIVANWNNENYVDALNLARWAFYNEDYDTAEKYFIKASDVNLFEIPNYRVWLDIGETKCLVGKKEEGVSYLLDFIVATQIVLGEKSCDNSDVIGSRRKTKYDSEIFEYQMSGRVESEMCKDSLLDYYGEYNDIEFNNKILSMQQVAREHINECQDLSD